MSPWMRLLLLQLQRCDCVSCLQPRRITRTGCCWRHSGHAASFGKDLAAYVQHCSGVSSWPDSPVCSLVYAYNQLLLQGACPCTPSRACSLVGSSGPAAQAHARKQPAPMAARTAALPNPTELGLTLLKPQGPYPPPASARSSMQHSQATHSPGLWAQGAAPRPLQAAPQPARSAPQPTQAHVAHPSTWAASASPRLMQAQPPQPQAGLPALGVVAGCTCLHKALPAVGQCAYCLFVR